MNLAQAVAKETGAPLDRVLLLRHFDRKMSAIARVGATVEEFSLTQPSGTRYDFSLPEDAPIAVVAVIAGGRVESLYRIAGVQAEGSNRRITSSEFRALDGAMAYPERLVKRFSAKKLKSKLVGKPVAGWTSLRIGVARAGGKLFDSVVVED